LINEGKCLGLILARGGSKRIPKKNLALLAGHPLIYWTIAAAKKSTAIDSIVVSSDDTEILALATSEGVDVIERPQELSQDDSSSMATAGHAINVLQASGTEYDYFFLLQPTSPLRCAEDLNGAARLLACRNADAIVGVTEVEHPVEWSTKLENDDALGSFFRQNKQFRKNKRLEKTFRINGAIYLAKVARFLEEGTLFFESNIYAYVMSRDRSVDIDEPIDMKFAELEILERQYQESIDVNS